MTLHDLQEIFSEDASRKTITNMILSFKFSGEIIRKTVALPEGLKYHKRSEIDFIVLTSAVPDVTTVIDQEMSKLIAALESEAMQKAMNAERQT